MWNGAGATADAGSAAATHAADMAGNSFIEAAGQEGGYYVAEFLMAMRKLAGFFGYLTSFWSLACLVEVGSRTKQMMYLLIAVGSGFKPYHHLCCHTTTP